LPTPVSAGASKVVVYEGFRTVLRKLNVVQFFIYLLDEINGGSTGNENLWNRIRPSAGCIQSERVNRDLDHDLVFVESLDLWAVCDFHGER
jgi:hypothetical protein